MARHSKWHNIKHRKAAMDRKRGQIWSKCSRAIMAAARSGGPDPTCNLALRYAIDEARYANMPRDTIERAIRKGAGESGGEHWEPVRYEGYGPGGVALLIDALTDNRTRTVSELRQVLTRHGGTLGTAGSVAYLFEPRGLIVIAAHNMDENRLMELAARIGAEDLEPPLGPDGAWTITTPSALFQSAKDALEQAGCRIEEAQLAMVPTVRIPLQGDVARRVLALIEALEDLDDVQRVHTNADFPAEVLAGETP